MSVMILFGLACLVLVHAQPQYFFGCTLATTNGASSTGLGSAACYAGWNDGVRSLACTFQWLGLGTSTAQHLYIRVGNKDTVNGPVVFDYGTAGVSWAYGTATASVLFIKQGTIDFETQLGLCNQGDQCYFVITTNRYPNADGELRCQMVPISLIYSGTINLAPVPFTSPHSNASITIAWGETLPSPGFQAWAYYSNFSLSSSLFSVGVYSDPVTAPSTVDAIIGMSPSGHNSALNSGDFVNLQMLTGPNPYSIGSFNSNLRQAIATRTAYLSMKTANFNYGEMGGYFGGPLPSFDSPNLFFGCTMQPLSGVVSTALGWITCYAGWSDYYTRGLLCETVWSGTNGGSEGTRVSNSTTGATLFDIGGVGGGSADTITDQINEYSSLWWSYRHASDFNSVITLCSQGGHCFAVFQSSGYPNGEIGCELQPLKIHGSTTGIIVQASGPRWAEVDLILGENSGTGNLVMGYSVKFCIQEALTTFSLNAATSSSPTTTGDVVVYMFGGLMHYDTLGTNNGSFYGVASTYGSWGSTAYDLLMAMSLGNAYVAFPSYGTPLMRKNYAMTLQFDPQEIQFFGCQLKVTDGALEQGQTGSVVCISGYDDFYTGSLHCEANWNGLTTAANGVEIRIGNDTFTGAVVFNIGTGSLVSGATYVTVNQYNYVPFPNPSALSMSFNERVDLCAQGGSCIISLHTVNYGPSYPRGEMSCTLYPMNVTQSFTNVPLRLVPGVTAPGTHAKASLLIGQTQPYPGVVALGSYADYALSSTPYEAIILAASAPFPATGTQVAEMPASSSFAVNYPTGSFSSVTIVEPGSYHTTDFAGLLAGIAHNYTYFLLRTQNNPNGELRGNFGTLGSASPSSSSPPQYSSSLSSSPKMQSSSASSSTQTSPASFASSSSPPSSISSSSSTAVGGGAISSSSSTAVGGGGEVLSSSSTATNTGTTGYTGTDSTGSGHLLGPCASVSVLLLSLYRLLS